ncbi:MAG: hypothetical protein A2Y56_08675 [Candidatus Aminicenantes bacterium RBG_13_63_10]|nr:MAG: hypothetical protein A2Y56_08675 [Candidatus Aminicenantes bacterium RBG_13_63_10]
MAESVFFRAASASEPAEALALKAESLFLELGFEEKVKADAFVALKSHFGEKNNKGHIRSAWLSKIVDRLKRRSRRVFFTDTNTLYAGPRSNAVEHTRLAWDHGFSPDRVGVPLLIADGLIGGDSEEVKVDLGRVKTAKLASGIVHSDFLVCFSHITGHIIAGVGGAVKNLGMGCASRAGKLEQHSSVHPKIKAKSCTNCGVCLDYCPAAAIEQVDGSARILDEKCIGCGECLVVCKAGAVKMRWDEDAGRLQEKMAEYAYAVRSLFRDKAAYLNFVLNVTKDCDCMSQAQKPVVADIGILASSDPLALDKASIDLVLKSAGTDVFRRGYDVDWSVQLRHGSHIGLGSLDYELVSKD